MKILIALDASPHSERAVDFVARIRWPAGSRVMVLSVMQPVTHPAAGPYDAATLEAEMIAERCQRLEDVVSSAERRLRENGFATEGRVLVGDPRESLTQAARSERADLLVMGSHGRTGIAKLMLGSVSSHIVTHASCSVLVVKSGSQTDGASEAPTGGKRI